VTGRPLKEISMRHVALALGIVGGAAGLFAGIHVLVNAERDVLVWLAALAIVASGIGIIGAASCVRLPRTGALLLIVGACGGLLAFHWYYLPAAFLFLGAALLAFLGRHQTGK